MTLNTLAGVLAEMTRIYRLTLNGRISPETSTKLTFVLEKIRSGIEALPPEPQFIGGGTTINIFGIESGRFLRQDAMSRLANGESPFDIGADNLLEPITIEHAPIPPAIEHAQPTHSAEVVRLRPADPASAESIESLIETYSGIAAEVEIEADDLVPKYQPLPPRIREVN
jgi:hypothetical protein